MLLHVRFYFIHYNKICGSFALDLKYGTLRISMDTSFRVLYPCHTSVVLVILYYNISHITPCRIRVCNS